MEGEEGCSYVRAYTLALGALPSMVTRAACQLGIPDILHAHQGQPLSALQLTSHLPFSAQYSPPPPPHQTAAYLDRFMRFLCSLGVFNAHPSSPTTYTLSPVSTWLLNPRATIQLCPPRLEVTDLCCHASSATCHDVHDFSSGGSTGSDDQITHSKHVGQNTRDTAAPSCTTILDDVCSTGDMGVRCKDAPTSSDKSRASLLDFMLFQTCGVLQPPLQHLAQFILEGGEGPFYKAHGMDGWAFLNSDPAFSHLFHAGMACDADITVTLLLDNYHGFDDVHTLVDVGGGIGTIASRIVARYPAIEAVNFDLPYVVATAPTYPGVKHIGGDMFQDIPRGDAIFIRSTLHTWNDESCIKILKSCHKALPRHGKLIIMDIVLSDGFENKSALYNLQVALDVLMMVNTPGGKERTKQEWEFIFKAANFQLNKVVELPCPQCIMEAFPTYDS